MDNQEIKVLNLTKQEIELLHIYSKYITIIPSKEPELYCTQVKNICVNLPVRIKDILNDFKLLKCACLLFKDFPVDNIITPDTNKQNVGEKSILSKIQALFVSYISEIIGYEGECSGNLFQDIIPDQKMSSLQSSVSCDNELEIHTEQAFSKLRPDILCLGCLRGANNAFTYILPVSYILEHITTHEYNLLKQPLWMFGVDYSFKHVENNFIEGNIRGPFPILGKNNYLLFDQNLITGITEEANSVIKLIIDIYYKYRIAYCLEPGDILLINNNQVVHGRSPFKANYDGNDRFLIRCFGTYDLQTSLHARKSNSRIIDSIYS
jgi:L-asparagine oxygenase